MLASHAPTTVTTTASLLFISFSLAHFWRVIDAEWWPGRAPSTARMGSAAPHTIHAAAHVGAGCALADDERPPWCRCIYRRSTHARSEIKALMSSIVVSG